jgi:transcriptional regulator GlxA family with amidase domain
MSSLTIGILIFPDAEELDFVGPWEVFTMSAMARNKGVLPKGEVVLISESGEPVRAAKGMAFLPDCSIETAPKLDVLLIPGGMGTRVEVENKILIDWIAKVSADCTWVTSVCTGAVLLAEAGPAAGKRVTTHWGFVEELRAHGKVAEVVENIRYVRDGNVITAAGVSAGIDMALWLIGEIWGQDHARTTQHYMEYYPSPPYAGAT